MLKTAAEPPEQLKILIKRSFAAGCAALLPTIILPAMLLFAGPAAAQTDTTTTAPDGGDSLRVIGADSAGAVQTDSLAADTVSRTLHARVFNTGADWPRPNKAVLLSASFPGLGQVYNRSYWKLPLVYGALGACAFFIVRNQRNYAEFRDAYWARVDDDPLTTDPYADRYTNAETLRELRNFYRRNRDFTIMLSVAAYLLNILDAYVDAHLKHFDVSDNLSLRLDAAPAGRSYRLGAGFSINF